MTPAQRAMAAKPTLAQITRANDRFRDAMAPQTVRKLHEFTYHGWLVRVYESWITTGWVYACADRVLLHDGKPGASDSAEFPTADEARAWVKALA